MKWYCTLTNGLICTFDIDEHDDLTDARKKQHEIWHTNCRAQKRNNTEGEVKWILK